MTPKYWAIFAFEPPFTTRQPNVALFLQVVALILSDVIGDPLDLIASGPTVYSESRPEEVWAVLEHHGLSASLPASVREVLGKAGPQWRREMKHNEGAGHVLNTVIGSNSIALESAARFARGIGLRPVVLSPGVCGDVRSVAHLYSLLARFACAPGASSSALSTSIQQLGPEVGVESWDLCRVMQALSEGRGEGWDATCPPGRRRAHGAADGDGEGWAEPGAGTALGDGAGRGEPLAGRCVLERGDGRAGRTHGGGGSCD